MLLLAALPADGVPPARLRRLDEEAEIIMLEKGEFISFANCGLPYYLSGVIADKEKLFVQTPQSFTGRFNVDVRIFSEVVSVDGANKTVHVKNHKDGTEYDLSYDELVLSPGAVPVVREWKSARTCRFSH